MTVRFPSGSLNYNRTSHCTGRSPRGRFARRRIRAGEFGRWAALGSTEKIIRKYFILRLFGGMIILAGQLAFASVETVMTEGMQISATTDQGKIVITAGHGYNRTYNWNECVRSVELWPRTERWYGSLGLYYPGPGSHWKICGGVTRGVVQEGQQHFETPNAAVVWIHSYTYLNYVYSNDGLVVGWKVFLPREELTVDVWQILIKGKKPATLSGAFPDSIKVTFKK